MISTNALAYFAICIGVCATATTAAAQNLRELARQHSIRNPGVPLDHPAPPGDYRPRTIEELTKAARVVLQARLTRINSYLSSTEDRVLTDYSIDVVNVLAGDVPSGSARTPGKTAALILTVFGGEVLIDGVSVRSTDYNREAIKNGGQYLLFLKQSRRPETGRYEIQHGGIFEISQDEVKPLLKEADRVFKGSVDARLNDLVARIRAAANVR